VILELLNCHINSIYRISTVGGIAPPPITAGGRGFVVENSDFLNIEAAQGRSCDIQHNQCADLANSADGRSSGLTVSQCDQQVQSCRAAGTSGSADNDNANNNSNVNGTTSGAGSGQSNTGYVRSWLHSQRLSDIPFRSSGAGNSGSGQDLQTFTGARKHSRNVL
jgi:hypothetical protein